MILDVVEIAQMIGSSHHVAAVHVDDPLRLAGGTGGVEDVKRMLGIDGDRLDVGFALRKQLIEIYFMRPQFRFDSALKSDDMLQRQVLDGLFDDAAQIYAFAAPYTSVTGDHDFGAGVEDAISQCTHPHACIDDGVNGA